MNQDEAAFLVIVQPNATSQNGSGSSFDAYMGGLALFDPMWAEWPEAALTGRYAGDRRMRRIAPKPPLVTVASRPSLEEARQHHPSQHDAVDANLWPGVQQGFDPQAPCLNIRMCSGREVDDEKRVFSSSRIWHTRTRRNRDDDGRQAALPHRLMGFIRRSQARPCRHRRDRPALPRSVHRRPHPRCGHLLTSQAELGTAGAPRLEPIRNV